MQFTFHKQQNTHRRSAFGEFSSQLGPFQYPERCTAAVLRHHVKRVMKQERSSICCANWASKEYQRHVPNLAPSVLRQLEACQLALKHVANAKDTDKRNKSCQQLGRKRGGKWHGAQVIYGDTDSLFVKLPGYSVKEAFAFGEEFCSTVTAANPPPVQLKLEKVYAATLLQMKKKYCGMKFESPEEQNPIFEAKRIERVRRDQCALMQSILQNALITMFWSGIGMA
eukprot:11264422-Ditylum_brightwellii.AAC.1